jgi:hypothetical protein
VAEGRVRGLSFLAVGSLSIRKRRRFAREVPEFGLGPAEEAWILQTMAKDRSSRDNGQNDALSLPLIS